MKTQKKLLTDKKEKLLGFLGILFLVAGTMRAIQLEADNQKIIYILGSLATIYALNAVWVFKK